MKADLLIRVHSIRRSRGASCAFAWSQVSALLLLGRLEPVGHAVGGLSLALPFPARRLPARLGAQARLGALPRAGRAGIVHCTVILAVTGAAVLAPQISACDAAICTAFAASPCHKLSGCVPDFRPSNEEAEVQVYSPPAAGAPNAPRAASAPLFWLIGLFVSPLPSDHDAVLYLARRSIY